MPPALESAIRRSLLAWYRKTRRDLPWRRTTDPYRIWLSEVMLQQTRAAAAIPYYERFLERFPTVEALAGAPLEEVLALWAGLGYYSRARNLHKAAQAIRFEGAFPSSYGGIRALAGVGDYTAAAVASIAFGLPYAALDGNVMRVLSRVSEEGSRPRLGELAAKLLSKKDPGDWNQALMELGAMVCLPRAPRCGVCPIALHCLARRSGRQADFPVRSARRPAEKRIETLFIVRRGGAILLWQRPADDRRLAGFWELPGPAQLPGARRRKLAGSFVHTIVQTRYRCEVWAASIEGKKPGALRWAPRDEIARLPLSTTARKALAMRPRYGPV